MVQEVFGDTDRPLYFLRNTGGKESFLFWFSRTPDPQTLNTVPWALNFAPHSPPTQKKKE
jgi:hypothetical protein